MSEKRTWKICVGTTRPLFDSQEMRAMLPNGAVYCPGCQQLLFYGAGVIVSRMRECWQNGHFDTPVYAEITEEQILVALQGHMLGSLVSRIEVLEARIDRLTNVNR